MLVTQLCPTLGDPIDCSLPSVFFHEILQARILEWVAVPFSRASSWPRERIGVCCIACRFFTNWAKGKPSYGVAVGFKSKHLAPESKHINIFNKHLKWDKSVWLDNYLLENNQVTQYKYRMVPVNIGCLWDWHLWICFPFVWEKKSVLKQGLERKLIRDDYHII